MSLQEELRGWIDTNKVSQNRVAASIGISSAVLSDWLKGKYKGNNADVDALIKSFLEQRHEKGLIEKVEIKIVPTRSLKKICGTARNSLLECEICVCVGEAGVGKTVAVKYFAAQYPSVILIEADPMYSAYVLFSKIHKMLSGGDGRGSFRRLFDECVDRLRGTERLIIVDEAEFLPKIALETLRRLHDFAGIGILLVGMPRLIQNLRGAKVDFKQLYSRVGCATEITDITEEDTENIVEAYTGSTKHSALFYGASKKNTRVLVQLIKRSMLFAKKQGRAIEESDINGAAKTLII